MAALLATSSLMLSVLVIAPAHAGNADPVPPIANPDHVTAALGSSVTADVLANDSDPNPDPQALWICGMRPKTNDTVDVRVKDDKVLLTPFATAKLHQLDLSYCVQAGCCGKPTWGTLHVMVTYPRPIKATVVGPNRFRACNSNDWNTGFGYGKNVHQQQGMVILKAHTCSRHRLTPPARSASKIGWRSWLYTPKVGIIDLNQGVLKGI